MSRIWTVDTLGEPIDVLMLRTRAIPSPGPGEVVVDMGACSLNFPDVLLCRGAYQQKPDIPFTPGLEAAGTVADVGPNVVGLSSGQKVIVIPQLPAGGLADQILIPAEHVFPIGDSLLLTKASCLFGTYQTAHFGLHRRAALRPGETLLVHAGAGGVGSAAIQLGKAAGARVIATAGGKEKTALLPGVGADVAIDYSTEDFTERVMDETHGRGVDVVLDPVGGEVLSKSIRCTAWEGRVVVAGFAGGEIPKIAANRILLRNISLVGLHWGPYTQHAPHLVKQTLDDLLALLADSRIDPMVDVRQFAEAPQALEDLAHRRTVGKVVIER
ncbi:NADPH:quinone oxidoreductase family protein [Rhodococcus sp. C3V]|uniref:NADPH:quinone oxidoreductase family protein n=1 Tax=Rhodococcus sp. C3V TaxID=3034165 RepID=UPI0023E18767|nr:NADPH:quinone oxidoreductase family protein [Rhodococcus sp. C3V]MDF3319966.1 NADPH:quinone oxidoreductase family protein [Rhodococcus sp. C3V]